MGVGVQLWCPRSNSFSSGENYSSCSSEGIHLRPALMERLSSWRKAFNLGCKPRRHDSHHGSSLGVRLQRTEVGVICLAHLLGFHFRQEIAATRRRSRYSCGYHSMCSLEKIGLMTQMSLSATSIGRCSRHSSVLTFVTRFLLQGKPDPSPAGIAPSFRDENDIWGDGGLPGAWGRRCCLLLTRTRMDSRDVRFPLRCPLPARDENGVLISSPWD